jgi:hypothetical protein
MAQTEKTDPSKLPELLFRTEADALYGPAVTAQAQILAFDREMAELSDKMILEVMALFDDHEIELDFSEESLDELDLLVDQQWPNPIEEPEVLDAIVANWGAYLGQLILENLGGKWAFRKDLDHASIHFERLDLEAFPLHVVRKRFQLGKGESLSGYYQGLVDRLTN